MRISTLIFILSTFLLHAELTMAQCEGDIILTTQSEVNAFSCSFIGGNLIIQESIGTSDPIVDLDPIYLGGLDFPSVVSGDVIVNGCSQLSTLFGLDGIQDIGGELRISDNPSLSDFQAFDVLITASSLSIENNATLISPSTFSSLVDCPGRISFIANDGVTLLSGFDQLTTCDELNISNNDALAEIAAFPLLAEVQSEIQIFSNDALTNIAGLELLSTAQNIYLGINPLLVELSGFHQLTTVSGFWIIEANHSLSQLDGPFSLISVDFLSIIANDMLTEISGFSDINDVNGLAIQQNDILTTVQGFSEFLFINTSLNISENPLLEDCCQIAPLVSVASLAGASVTLENNHPDCDSTDDLVSPGVTFTSQSQIDNWEFCGPIQGDLIIMDDNDGVDDIVDLDPLYLAGLFGDNGSVSGDLVVEGCNSLTTLFGLDGISEIGGAFRIVENEALSALDDGIDPINVGGGVFIEENMALTEISDFFSITTTPIVNIIDNESLVSLSGFSFLEELDELIIQDHPLLNSVPVFSELTTVSDELAFIANNGTSNLTYFPVLTQTGRLDISENASLTGIDLPNSLTEVGFLSFEDNPVLTTISGMSDLNSAARISIINNPDLQSLPNFSEVSTPLDILEISHTSALEDYSGFQNIPSVEEVYFLNNQNLTSLDVLSALTTASDGIFIRQNPALTSVQGFDQLEVVGTLRIEENIALNDVQPFPSISTIEELDISENSSLASCCWIAPLAAVTSDMVTVENNAIGCNSLEEIGGSSDIVITTQTEMDELSLCGNVIASLLIEDAPGTSDPIVSWSPALAGDIAVLGDLIVRNCQALTEMDGLTSISNIGGDFIVEDNPAMEDLFGDLMSFQSVGGEMLIADMPMLTYIGDFPALENIAGALTIRDCSSHQQVLGFDALLSLGGLSIFQMDQIEFIDGFSALEALDGPVNINSNAILESVFIMSSLTDMTDINVAFHPIMQSAFIGANIESCSGDINFLECPELEIIPGYSELTEVEGFMQFLNTGLAVFPEFPSLTNLGGLSINDNQQLESLNSLASLSALSGNLSIIDNPLLSMVDIGAATTTFTGDNLVLLDNTVLAECCWVIPFIEQAEDNGANVNIAGNSGACATEAGIMESIGAISCGAPLELTTESSSCEANFQLVHPAVSDNCGIPTLTLSIDGATAISVVPASSQTFSLGLGSHTFDYIAMDDQGNTTTCAQLVEVMDMTPPVWNAGPVNVTLEGQCGLDDPAQLAAANMPGASDACGAVSIVQEGFVINELCGNSAEYVYSYRAVDVADNETIDTRTLTVTLLDSQAPVITGVPADVLISCGQSLPEAPSPSAFDQCAGDVTSDMTLDISSTSAPCDGSGPATILTYTWTAMDACGNTTQATWDISVLNDFDFDLGPDVFVCDEASYTIAPSIPGAEEYNWSNGSTSSSITVTETGEYTLQVFNQSGCCYTESVNVVFGAAPDAVASGAELDCSGAGVSLSGSSTTPGVSYAWAGPGGFTSSLQNPVVNVAGLYTLTVTSAGGCSSTATATVTANTDAPDVSATGGTIDCTTSEVILQASSSITGSSYAWTGPGGFQSSAQNPMVNQPGVYTVTVTAPNDCIASANAEVILDDQAPQVTLLTQDIDCAQPSAPYFLETVGAISQVSWTLDGNTFLPNGSTLDEAGIYEVTVLGENGCSSSFSAEVIADFESPQVSATGNVLDCATTQVTLDGSSSSPGASFSWTGPNGYSSVFEDAVVSEIGDYTLTVTGLNGCAASQTVTVTADSDVPVIDLELQGVDCAEMTAELVFSSSIDLDEFSWAGPGGFSSVQEVTTIDDAGIYTFFALGENGCSATESIDVALDFNYETQLNTTDVQGGELGTAELIISGGTGPFEIEWDNGQTGPMADGLDVGDHTVMVTDGLGCTQILDFFIDMTIGLTEQDIEAQFDVYPNPTQGEVFLEWSSPMMTIERVEVIDMQGKILAHFDWNGLDRLVFSTSEMASGMYLIRAIGDQGVIQQRLIRE